MVHILIINSSFPIIMVVFLIMINFLVMTHFLIIMADFRIRIPNFLSVTVYFFIILVVIFACEDFA
jgi:hypothetical protein